MIKRFLRGKKNVQNDFTKNQQTEQNAALLLLTPTHDPCNTSNGHSVVGEFDMFTLCRLKHLNSEKKNLKKKSEYYIK